MLLLQVRVVALVCLAACLTTTLAFEVRSRCLSFSLSVTCSAELILQAMPGCIPQLPLPLPSSVCGDSHMV